MDYDDNELRRQLVQFGVQVGPITDSTRDLYKRMLQRKIKGNNKTSKQSGGGRRTNTNPTSSSGHKFVNSAGSRNFGSINSPPEHIGLKNAVPQSTGKWPAKSPTYEAEIKRPNRKFGSVNSPPEHTHVKSIVFQSTSHTGKRPASSPTYEAESKRPRLEKVTEEPLESSPKLSKPIASSSPKYQRLYPTLPEDVASEYLAQPEEPSPVQQRVTPRVQKPQSTYRPSQSMSPPKIASPPRASVSPPSPLPISKRSSSFSRNGNGGGLFSVVGGIIGAGVQKIVDLASPRPSLRSAKKSSTGSRKKSHSNASVSGSQSSASSFGASPSSSLHDTVPIDEIEPVDEIEVSPPANLLPEPESLVVQEESSSEEREHYDWELLPTDVEICKKANGSLWRLGKGGFGEVFKGLKDSVDEVAVKVIRIQNSSVAIEQFKKEIDIISKLRHRHILQFYGACVQPNCFYMVTELMQTDLFSSLRNNKRYHWTGIYGKEVLLGIASGLHYLHSRRPPVVHRDIKSPNILLMDGIAKIADVGIARTKSDSDMTAQRGFTIAWAAPEVVYRRRATEKIDIWGFGVIIWEVVTGKMPRVGHLDLPSDAPPSLRLLYNSCVEEEPTKRPSAGEAVRRIKSIK